MESKVGKVSRFRLFLCLFVAIFKTLEQPRKVKNSAIMLKIGTIVDWINTCEIFFL